MWGKFAGFSALFLPLGYGLAVFAWFALTPAQNALRCVLRSLVRTTATVGQKLKTGRVTALGSGSYSYWFRNCGGTGGFCGGGSYFKELSGCSYWNLVYFG